MSTRPARVDGALPLAGLPLLLASDLLAGVGLASALRSLRMRVRGGIGVAAAAAAATSGSSSSPLLSLPPGSGPVGGGGPSPSSRGGIISSRIG